MITFPFKDQRAGQETIIKETEAVVKNGDTLMIHAATGMGKTAPVIYGALKASLEKGLRVVFLTARHTHQNIVYDTIRKINAVSSDKITFTGINGKLSMCLLENSVEPHLFIEFCRAVREQDMCNFYSNVFSKSKDIKSRALQALSSDISDPGSIMNAGRKFEVCPYEISLLNAKKSKVIVANYSHVFDQDVAPSFMTKAGINAKNSVLIVDEAHNLHSKIVDINSFSMSLKTVEKAYDEAILSGEIALSRKIDGVVSEARKVKAETVINLTDTFSVSDIESMDSVIKQKEDSYNIPAMFTLKRFATFLSKVDDSYLQYASVENGRVKINITALDPSDNSRQTIKSFASSILISGTFKPMDVFADLLGIKDAKKVVIDDGVLSSNRLIINETDLTSKFSDRNKQIELIAERIDDLLENFRHNIIVFFTSYAFIDSVSKLLKHTDKVIKESRNMGREDKEAIISEMSKPGKCLFAVIGGNFSESIGVRNNAVKMIVIVGIPFEPPSVKLKAFQAYYQKKFSNGFEYAQVLPAMVKTMQAAGRGIRSSTDRAVILLLDSRFDSAAFRKFLPDGIKTVNGSPINFIKESGFN
ncbi:MAG: ATP-dependent DNA helicase [Candidatus Parvarchaeota archaeon]|nr:ATP-dependent DNA helicase [Candidatus Parvarchaeota archaeon]